MAYVIKWNKDRTYLLSYINYRATWTADQRKAIKVATKKEARRMTRGWTGMYHTIVRLVPKAGT